MRTKPKSYQKRCSENCFFSDTVQIALFNERNYKLAMIIGLSRLLVRSVNFAFDIGAG